MLELRSNYHCLRLLGTPYTIKFLPSIDSHSLPLQQKNNTILITTIQIHFPHTTSLYYRINHGNYNNGKYSGIQLVNKRKKTLSYVLQKHTIIYNTSIRIVYTSHKNLTARSRNASRFEHTRFQIHIQYNKYIKHQRKTNFQYNSI
jgi:hypothetical protein